jgi:mono/diheme cytochrome c family protein
MKKIIVTVLATIVILFGSFYIYISTGCYDISQLTPHNNLTRSLIRTTTHSSIDKRMKDVVVPANLKDTSLIIEGFHHYNSMCKMCHGAPGIKPEEMAEGLYPKPPLIYKHVEEDDAQEFFWIIKNGIKMTSMPAYKPTHDDQRIWAITAFVTQKLDKMSPEEYKQWEERYGEHD